MQGRCAVLCDRLNDRARLMVDGMRRRLYVTSECALFTTSVGGLAVSCHFWSLFECVLARSEMSWLLLRDGRIAWSAGKLDVAARSSTPSTRVRSVLADVQPSPSLAFPVLT